MANAARILVVDDDPRIAASLRRALVYEGYEVAVAADGLAALHDARERRPDLVVLDVMLPGLDGVAVCRRLRAAHDDSTSPGQDVAILMLTARDATADRVLGLDSGADDYLTKPFATDEFLARVRALLRRRGAKEPADTCPRFDDLTLDPAAREVRRGDRLVPLTVLEFDLLTCFLRHPRQVLTRDQLLNAVWGQDAAVTSNAVDVYVGYLRTKIEAAGESRLIQTVRGVGYVLRAAESPAAMTARRSIRARIAIFGSIVVALTLVLVGLLVYLLAFLGGARDRDRALAARAKETVSSLAVASADSFTPRRAPAPSEIADADAIFVAILAEDGAMIVSTGEIGGAPPPLPATLLQSAAENETTTTLDFADGTEARLHIVPWSRPDLGRSGYVVAGQSTRRLREDLNGIIVFLAVAALIGLVAAFAANWRGAGRALRPLRSMAGAADEIGGAEDLSRRLPSPHPRDEIGRLTESFNGMLARLEQAHARLTETLDHEQRFVADASHELRTPLTSIRTNADFLLAHPDADPADHRAAVADIAAESERMGRLVHDLLTLARADAGQPLDRVPVDPLPLLADIVRQTRRLHPGREIALVRDPGITAGKTTVAGDPAALRRLVLILVDNALLHGGATARVWLCLSAADGRTLVRVADDGPGIPASDLDRVFERFHQVDSSRGGGVGLGLAIARWITEAHGGRIWAVNNDGPGASFLVALPRARIEP